jgi:hypothetical protein
MALSNKVWGVRLRSLAAISKRLDPLVHELGVDAMNHASEFGDARRMDQLINTLPKGYRQEGFKVWVHTFSPIRWNGDGKVGLLTQTSKKFVAFNLDKAADTPFWTMEEAKEKVKELTLASLRALLERTVKQIESADEDGNVVNKDGRIVATIPTAELIDMKKAAAKLKKAA